MNHITDELADPGVTPVGTNFSELSTDLAATIQDLSCLRISIGNGVKFYREFYNFFCTSSAP